MKNRFGSQPFDFIYLGQISMQMSESAPWKLLDVFFFYSLWQPRRRWIQLLLTISQAFIISIIRNRNKHWQCIVQIVQNWSNKNPNHNLTLKQKFLAVKCQVCGMQREWASDGARCMPLIFPWPEHRTFLMLPYRSIYVSPAGVARLLWLSVFRTAPTRRTTP